MIVCSILLFKIWREGISIHCSLIPMNDSDFTFDIQERIAIYSNEIDKDVYWSFYDEFLKAIQNNQISPISVIVMNTTLLQKFKRGERILYERPECLLEELIMKSFEQVTIEKELANLSNSLIGMLNEYSAVFWLSSCILKTLFQFINCILSKLKEIKIINTQDIDKVFLETISEV